MFKPCNFKIPQLMIFNVLSAEHRLTSFLRKLREKIWSIHLLMQKHPAVINPSTSKCV